MIVYVTKYMGMVGIRGHYDYCGLTTVTTVVATVVMTTSDSLFAAQVS